MKFGWGVRGGKRGEGRALTQKGPVIWKGGGTGRDGVSDDAAGGGNRRGSLNYFEKESKA